MAATTDAWLCSHGPNWFIEIKQPKEITTLPERIDCYILVNIDPKCCGPLARELNAVLPLRSATSSSDIEPSADGSAIVEPNKQQQFPITDHLKRIRRRPASAEDITKQIKQDTRKIQNNHDCGSDTATTTSSSTPSRNPKKRAKKSNNHNGNGSEQQAPRSWSLDILVGSVEIVDDLLCRHSDTTSNNSDLNTKRFTLESILLKYNLSPTQFTRKSLPGRSAETKEELQDWNTTLWPTLFFEKKTTHFKEEELLLSPDEVGMMIKGMEAAVEDATAGRQQWSNYASTSDNNEDSTNDCVALSGVLW